MTAPYARRKINVFFQLGTGSFGGGSANTIKHIGLRVIAEITLAVLPHPGQAVLQVYGLTLSEMNALTVAGLQYRNRENKVLVQAGDDQSGMTDVFNGTIIEAYPDFTNEPDTPFVVVATYGAGIQLKPVDPVSFNSTVPVETALQQILKPAGLTLENNNVNTQFAYPYFQGTVMTQLRMCLRAAGCLGTLDMVANKVAIWPKDSSRSGNATLVSEKTGMITAPKFEQAQVKVRTLFNPALAGGVGKKMQIESILKAAQGDWTIVQVDLNLASELEGGPWEMTIVGNIPQGVGGGSNSAPAAASNQ